MKYLIVALVIFMSGSLFGQTEEHCFSKYCDYYIGSDPGKAYHEKYLKAFPPTRAEVDSVEMVLKTTHDNFKNSIESIDRYIRYYSGFINEKGHRTLHIYADFKPDKNGIKKSDGEWLINYDTITKKFYDFREIGG